MTKTPISLRNAHKKVQVLWVDVMSWTGWEDKCHDSIFIVSPESNILLMVVVFPAQYMIGFLREALICDPMYLLLTLLFPSLKQDYNPT